MNSLTNKKESFSGIEKCAIILMRLPEEKTAEILKRLDIDEIRELTKAMSSLGAVNQDSVENTLIEFVSELSTAGALVGSIETTEQLLKKTLDPIQAKKILEELRGPAGRTIWDKLGNMNEEVLSNYLKKEYPQTSALILSRLKADSAARILTTFPEPLAAEVMLRILKIGPVKKEIIDNIEQTLKNEFIRKFSKSSGNGSYETLAEIFDNMDRSHEQKFLKNLEKHNPQAADKVKSLMFTFEDFSTLNDSSLQILIRSVDRNKLSLALKGCSADIQENFFKNISERAGRLMKDDMKNMGAVRLRDVEEAQGYIVNIARELSKSGEIFLQNNHDKKEEMIG